MAISDEVRRQGLAAIGVAATILVEDAHETLAVAPTADGRGTALSERLVRLGADLTALAGAAAVFARGD